MDQERHIVDRGRRKGFRFYRYKHELDLERSRVGSALSARDICSFFVKEMKMVKQVKYLCCTALLLSVLVCQGAPVAELATKKALTLEVAKRIAAASKEFAQKNKWNVVISIVDDGGHLVYFERMDGVQTGSIQVAIRKAQAAAAFKRPTRLFEEAVAGGRTVLVALPNGMPFEGGVPIKIEDQVIGAIGISGVTAQQDGMIAQAGVDAMPRILAK
jgi:uncharacterized protein GlcG (DUF336 family)